MHTLFSFHKGDSLWEPHVRSYSSPRMNSFTSNVVVVVKKATPAAASSKAALYVMSQVMQRMNPIIKHCTLLPLSLHVWCCLFLLSGWWLPRSYPPQLFVPFPTRLGHKRGYTQTGWHNGKWSELCVCVCVCVLSFASSTTILCDRMTLIAILRQVVWGLC